MPSLGNHSQLGLLQQKDENSGTNLVSLEGEESSGANGKYYHFNIILTNKASRKYIHRQHGEKITFYHP